MRASPQASAGRIRKDDFDAALVPGFREATRPAYRELWENADADMSRILDEHGRFLPVVEKLRDCPCCGSPRDDSRPFLEKAGMHIVTCARCGLTYSWNVLDAAYDHRRYVTSAAQPKFEALKRNEAYAALERTKCRYIIQRLGDVHPRPGRLFEIGPGAGRLLDAAKEAGWATSGLELNPIFATETRSRGHDITEGAFPQDLAPRGRYDAVAMLDVLEHLHHPREALESCRSLLGEGGVVIVQVPNFDSLLVRVEKARNINFSHGHWNYFSPVTLRNTAAAAGLQPLAVETIISEVDRIRAFPDDEVRSMSLEICGEAPPARLEAEWMHERLMGYKLLAFFAKRPS